MVNDWWDASLWVGIGGGGFGGRDKRLCCLWYSIGFGVRGLWVSIFYVFWVSFGVAVLGGVSYGLRYPLCVCARVAWCILCIYRREKTF